LIEDFAVEFEHADAGILDPWPRDEVGVDTQGDGTGVHGHLTLHASPTHSPFSSPASKFRKGFEEGMWRFGGQRSIQFKFTTL